MLLRVYMESESKEKVTVTTPDWLNQDQYQPSCLSEQRENANTLNSLKCPRELAPSRALMPHFPGANPQTRQHTERMENWVGTPEWTLWFLP